MFAGIFARLAAMGRGAASLGRTVLGRAGKVTQVAGGAVKGGLSKTGNMALTVGNLAFAGNQLISGVQSLIGSVTNDFTHIITVEVKGGPKANIKRIWQLAVSAAFGKYRQGVVGGGDLTLSATWDITGKGVVVQLHYTNKGLWGEIVNNTDTQRFNSYRQFLETGPSQELVGGDWGMWSTKIKGIDPNDVANASVFARIVSNILAAGVYLGLDFGAAGGRSPEEVRQGIQARSGRLQAEKQGKPKLEAKVGTVLPDDGRVILTSAKENPDVQPYRPDTDYLIALVSASLHDPCVLPVAPPTDGMAQQKLVRRGFRLYSPGSWPENKDKVNRVTDETNLRPLIIPAGIILPEAVTGVGGSRLNLGIDGYSEPISGVPSVAGQFTDPR